VVLRRKVADTSEKSHNDEFYNSKCVLSIVMVIKLRIIRRAEQLRLLRGGGGMQKFVQNNIGKKAQQNRPGRNTRRIEEDNIKRDLRKV
jgi:hypothetical protein